MAGYAIPAQPEEGASQASFPGEFPERMAVLYLAYAEPLRRFCTRRLGNGIDAEDALHETMLLAARALPTLSPESRIWSWLATIAANVCSNMRRRAERCEPVEQVPDAVGFDLDEEVAHRVRAAILVEAIDELPERLRSPLVLRDIMDWRYEDIAALVGRSVPWVKTTVMRTRRSLPARVAAVARRRHNWPLPVAVAERGRALREAIEGRLLSAGTRWRLSGRGRLSEAVVGAVPLVAPLLVALAAATASLPSPAVEPARATTTAAALALGTAPAGGPSSGSTTGRAQEVSTAPSTGRPSGSGPVLEEDVPELVPDVLYESPADVAVTSVTASPNYAEDHTVFAVGSTLCGVARCRLLYRSEDGGRSWRRVPAVGLTGDTVVLSPAYPADARIFAGGSEGDLTGTFQVSLDGGLTFQTLGPGTGRPVVSPGFAAGDPRIFVPDQHGWQYDDRSKAMLPLALTASLPVGFSSVLALSPEFPDDDTMWIGGVYDDVTRGVTAGYRCRRGTCLRSSMPEGIGNPRYLVGTGGPKGVVFASTSQWLARSDDGGITFERVSLPQSHGRTAVLFSVTQGPGGELFALQLQDGDGERWSVLHRSLDGGASWSEVFALRAQHRRMERLAVLDDGRMFGAVWPRGLVCSTDGGSTWAADCAS